MDIEVGQGVAPLVSALERASELINSGMNPGKALKQVAGEIEAYAIEHRNQSIPHRAFKLGRAA